MDTSDMKGGTVASLSDTTFRLYGLGDNTKYWFAVYVVNKSGVFSASSNRVSCTTKDQFPDSVTLLSLQQTSPSSVSMRWSRTVETDFASYGVYYSTDNNVHENSTRAGTFTSPNDTAMLVTGLDENKTYYFRVFAAIESRRRALVTRVFGSCDRRRRLGYRRSGECRRVRFFRMIDDSR